METTQTGSLMDRPDSPYTDHVDDSVLQISGAGHWFLEGWIGDHLVEFRVDSGSSVTAMSDSLYQKLVQTGGPVGVLRYTSRTLRCANGTGIGVSGCSHCVVSLMGLQTDFPILVCDLATGTDAIIGTDVWAPCWHIHWTLRMASCLHKGVLHSSYTDMIMLFPVVF